MTSWSCYLHYENKEFSIEFLGKAAMVIKIILIAILSGLVAFAGCATAPAVSKRPIDTWIYYHFDGRDFVAGQAEGGGVYVAMREYQRPLLLDGTAKIEAAALPPGKGAIAGICYIQGTGGKLVSKAGYAPCSRMPVRIYSGDTLVTTVQSDEQGYFVAVLDAGSYRIGHSPLAAEWVVENGRTTLVPLRAGKRMVD